MTIQKRGFYRIEYPVGVQPIMSVNGSTCHILELSEVGGRVSTTEARSTSFERGLEVTIAFQCGRSFVTDATLIRIEGDQNVLRFDPAIPLPVIIEEQRLLIIQFPKE